MSIVYSFALPTTGVFSYSQCISSSDYYQLLADADTHRARMRDVLKRAKRKNVQDVLEVVKVIEDYIPYAFTIKTGLETGELLLDTEIVTSWRLPLSAEKIHVVEAKRVQMPTIYFEVSMTLLAYAVSLLALAEEVYAAGSQDRWKHCTTHLLAAQSVLLYISTHQMELSSPAPIDLQPLTLAPLLNLISGSLHLLILYKPSTTSAALLTRVAIFALDKFTAANSLAPSQLLNTGLDHWLRDAKTLTTGLVQKYMAIDREAKHEVGSAIALCASARADLKPNLKTKLLAKPSMLSLDKDKEDDATGLQTTIKGLRRELEELEANYKAQNDRVMFQKIPDAKDVKRNWPSGREVVTLRGEWIPPKPIAGFDGTDDGVSAAPETSRTYSGQGQYY
ncbi:hypothetical protein V1512DRAFT_207338 [Lipomyces arxii]|uniref:uncharacterized protein n=1 Tax=Lipomyces arxii TaxID=56418 RepID=UPI0034CD1F47